MKKNKIENLIWILFFGIGLIFLIIGIIICINVFNYKDKIDTTGVITDITYYSDRDGDRNYNVYVKYEVNGIEYESQLNGYSSNFYEGKEIEIYYEKDNPRKIGVKSIDLIFLMFPGFGIIFSCIGGIGLFVRFKKKNIEKLLRETGSRIDANYIETVINPSYTINGQHPYNIICEWNNPMDNKKYIFRSKNIWVNPESIIEDRNITTFPVYIDMNNKKKYVIDIDGLVDNVVDLR